MSDNKPDIAPDDPDAEEIDHIGKYIGKEVTIENLAGRNFYLFTDGEKNEDQPIELETADLDLDPEEYADEDGYDALEEYLPGQWWVKRISASEDGFEAYYLTAVSLTEDNKIKDVILLLEAVGAVGGDYSLIPGKEIDPGCGYVKSDPDRLPQDITDELDLLVKGRALTQSFSFIGKRLPQKMIDNGGSGGSLTEYVYALRSAYRLAYMHMSIDTTEEGMIKALSCNAYPSTGSSYGDMFSRPRRINDRKDEAIDMLLHILDQYSEEEYESLF